MSANTSYKKRGRPPKTELKPKTVIFEQQKETEELVLYLPLTDKQNDFTINDTEYSVKQSSEKLSEDNVDDVTQKLSTADDVTSKLINEIKKRDIIIKNLKENLKNFKNTQQDNILNFNKDTKKTLVNLGLITLNDNKLIIADKSKFACWWCCYNFDTYPVFIPEKYVNGKYHVFGNFCSFSCVLAYNDTLNDYRKNIREGLIKKLYKDIFNTDCQIKAAGSREILEKFGGPVTIETYRDPKSVCSIDYKLTIPPQIPLLSYFEETNIS